MSSLRTMAGTTTTTCVVTNNELLGNSKIADRAVHLIGNTPTPPQTVPKMFLESSKRLKNTPTKALDGDSVWWQPRQRWVQWGLEISDRVTHRGLVSRKW